MGSGTQSAGKNLTRFSAPTRAGAKFSGTSIDPMMPVIVVAAVIVTAALCPQTLSRPRSARGVDRFIASNQRRRRRNLHSVGVR